MVAIFDGLAGDVTTAVTALFAGAFGVLVVALISLDLMPWVVSRFRAIFGRAS